MTENDIQNRQNAAPVQRRTPRIGQKSRLHRPLRRLALGVQVPYPPLKVTASTAIALVEIRETASLLAFRIVLSWITASPPNG